MLEPGLFVVLGFAAAAVVLGWVYFRRFALERPPIGVVTLGDIAFAIGGIVVVPYLYLFMPLWLVAGLLALATLSILTTMLQPLLRRRWMVWLSVLLVVGADIATAILAGTGHPFFFVVNNTALVLLVIGITNLWAQSGLKARDAAVLGGALAVYDVVATTFLPLMFDLIVRLSSIPFAPVIAWSMSDGGPIGIGLGDVLLATLFPLVMLKAFGQTAGITAMVIGLGTTAGLLTLAVLGLLPGLFPVMVALGPLMVAQYWYWRRRQGQERTTAQYLKAEPLSAISRQLSAIS